MDVVRSSREFVERKTLFAIHKTISGEREMRKNWTRTLVLKRTRRFIVGVTSFEMSANSLVGVLQEDKTNGKTLLDLGGATEWFGKREVQEDFMEYEEHDHEKPAVALAVGQWYRTRCGDHLKCIADLREHTCLVVEHPMVCLLFEQGGTRGTLHREDGWYVDSEIYAGLDAIEALEQEECETMFERVGERRG